MKLTPGNYDVALTNADWYLERDTNGVWQRVQQAVLLSATNQSSYVVDHGLSNLDFRFGVDGELLDFRAGDLQIGISIEQPGEGAPDAGWTGGIGGFGGTTGGFGGTTGGYGGTTGGAFGGITGAFGGATGGPFGGTTGGGYDAGF